MSNCPRRMIRTKMPRIPSGIVCLVFLSSVLVGYSEGQATPDITVGGSTFSCAVDTGRRDCGFLSISRATCVDNLNCCYNTSVDGIPFCFFGDNDNRCVVANREDCGFPGIQAHECRTSLSCCFDSNPPTSPAPYCFRDNGDNRCAVTSPVRCGRATISQRACVQQMCCFRPIPGNPFASIRCFFQAGDEECGVTDRIDCGFPGIEVTECRDTLRCCFDSSTPHVSHCFRRNGDNRCVVTNPIPCGPASISQRMCVQQSCCFRPSTDLSSPVRCFFQVGDQCAVEEGSRLQCGTPGITQQDCEMLNCCFFESDMTGVPTCFLPLLPAVEPTIQPVTDCGTDNQSLFLTCNIGEAAFNMSSSLNMNITITWRVNGMDVLVDTVIVGNMLNTIDATSLGNIFNQNVECCVNFTNERNDSVFECSPPFIFSIQQSVTTANVQEGEDVLVSFTTNGPALLWCNNTAPNTAVIVSGAVSEVIFNDPAAEHNSTQVVLRTESDSRIMVTPCGFEVLTFECNMANFQNPLQIRVRTLLDGKLEGNHTVIVNFYVLKPDVGCTELIGNLTINIEDMEGVRNPVCLGFSHLQIETFDGTNFSFRKEGTFVFYRHETFPFEIFIRVEECDSPDGPFPCACEATVRIDSITLVFSRCENTTRLLTLRSGGPLPTGAAVVRHPDGQTFSIYFPHGGILTLYSCVVEGLPFLFLKYLPSRFDLSASVGLCGLYDGNRKNDLLSGCGVITSVSQAHQFALSWRAFACPTACQFTGNDVFNMDGMQTIGPFCVCNIPHGNSFCIGDLNNTVDLNGTLPLKNKEILDVNMFTDIPAVDLEARLRSNFSEVVLTILKPPESPSNITFEEALALCNETILANVSMDCMMRLGSELINDITNDCAYAVVNSDSTIFVAFFIARLNQECRILLKHLLFDPGSSEDFGYKICNCDNQDCDPYTGLCRCGTKGGRYASCANSLAQVGYLSGNVLCDLSVETCQQVPVFGTNMRDDLNCEITDIQQVEKLSSDVEIKSDSIETTRATFLHEGQVNCFIERPRPVAINIDDDGERLPGDSQSRLFVPYDSRCFDCYVSDFDNKVSCTRQQAGRGCQIEGRCYGPYERSPTDDCLECRPKDDANRLLKRKTSECGGMQEERQLYSLFSLVVLFVAFAILTCVLYRIWIRRKQRQKEAEKQSPEPPPNYDLTLGFRGLPDVHRIGYPTAPYDGNNSWSSSSPRQRARDSTEGLVESEG